MSKSISTVLAVGAAGPSAGLVVPELARRGVKVRGLIRDPAQAEVVRRCGAAEVTIGDLRDAASVAAALEGVDAVFYIAPPLCRTRPKPVSAWCRQRNARACAASFFPR